MTQYTFRFLDLPSELRCIVYDHVDIPSVHHVLTRSDVDLHSSQWPPTAADAPQSSITFFRPGLPLDLLTTCRLVKQEALPILLARIKALESEPLNYLVDFAASVPLLRTYCVLHACISGIKQVDSWEHLSQTGKAFAAKGSYYAKQSKQVTVTILHKDGLVYRDETIWQLIMAEETYGRQIDVIYRTPFPDSRSYDLTNDVRTSGKAVEFLVLDRVRSRRAQGDLTCANYRPLDEEAFAKHLLSVMPP